MIIGIGCWIGEGNGLTFAVQLSVNLLLSFSLWLSTGSDPLASRALPAGQDSWYFVRVSFLDAEKNSK